MKKGIACLVIAGICCFPKLAKCGNTPCQFIKEYSMAVMTIRQKGYSKTECEKMLKDAFFGLEIPRVLSRQMDDIIDDAFTRPIYDSLEYKTEEIFEFSHDKYMECLDDLY